MKYEGNLLLQDIIQGKLFLNNNYIVCYGNNFPYWFLSYLGNYLKQQDFISNFEFVSYQSIFKEKEKLFNDMFLSLPTKALKNVLFIIYLSRDLLQKKDNIFLGFQNKNYYYILYIENQDIYLIEDHIICYNLSTTFSDVKKNFLWHFYKSTTVNVYNSGVVCFFDFFYENYNNYITLEVFFSLLPFIILINKKYFNIFLQHFIQKTISHITKYSIFDLATFFFQKEEVLFFSVWKIYQSKYTIEFWVHFWIEELSYAKLHILSNKGKINQNAIIKKKTNRWFIKFSNSYLAGDQIQTMLLKLLQIDIFSKKYQTNTLIHLNSFFISYFFHVNTLIK